MKWLNLKILLIVIALQLFNCNIDAQVAPVHHIEKPIVGLAMSGGGAKGLSYIGMLQVIDSIGLPVQFIAGTSMGAIIGGFTAIGYSPDYLLDLANNIDWNYLLVNRPLRQYVPYFEKNLRSNYILTSYIDDNFKIETPNGALRTQRLSDLFTRLYSPFYKIDDFSEFPVPFLCVAVDLQTGKPVEFTDGYLPDALVASMSIPIAVRPKNINGRLFVDGGMINNFPVINLYERGVENIIGFDVEKPVVDIDSINTVLKVANQIISVNRRFSTEFGYDNASVVMRPDIDDFGLASFGDTERIIEVGRNEVLKHEDYLVTLRDSLLAMGYQPNHHLNTKPLDSVYVDSYAFDGLNMVSADYVTSKFQFDIPGYVTFDEIEETLEILRASFLFDHAIYKLRPSENDEDNVMLAFEFDERSMNTVSAGLNYSNYRYVTFMMNLTMRNALLPSSLFTADLGLGLYPYLSAEYVFVRGKFFEPGVSLMSSFMPARYYRDNGSLIYRCSMLNTNISAFLKTNFHESNSMASLSLSYEKFNQLLPVGENVELGKSDFLTSGFRYYHNSLDNNVFSSKGFMVDLNGKLILADFDSQTNMSFFSNVDMKYSYSIGNDAFPLAINTRAFLGLSFGDNLPAEYRYYVGGNENMFTGMNIVNYPGLSLMRRSADNTFILTESLQYNLLKFNYLSLSAGLAAFDMNFTHFDFNDSFDAFVGLSYGIKLNPFPIEISLSRSLLNDEYTFLFNVGYFIR